MVARRAYEVPMPSTKGNMMPAREMAKAL